MISDIKESFAVVIYAPFYIVKLKGLSLHNIYIKPTYNDRKRDMAIYLLNTYDFAHFITYNFIYLYISTVKLIMITISFNIYYYIFRVSKK